MSTEVASLVLRVNSLEARAATEDLRKMAAQGQRTEGAMGKLGKSLLALGAVAAVGKVLGFIVSSTIEAEQATAQLEARLKSTGAVSGMTVESLKGLATSLMNVTTFSDEAIMASQALMLTFTKIGKDVFPQAQEAALNMSVALGSDLQGATMQLGKALNDPIKGIAALGRAGVQFTVEQKAMIKAMVAAGDTALAQKVILGELQTQMGGAARAARNTLGGALQNLKNQFGELAEGDADSPGVRGTTEAVNEFADKLASAEVRGAIQSIIQGLFSIGSAATQLVSALSVAGKQIGATLHAMVEGAKAQYEIVRNIQTYGMADGTVAGGWAKLTKNAENYRQNLREIKLESAGYSVKDLPGLPKFELPASKALPGIGAPSKGSFRAVPDYQPPAPPDPTAGWEGAAVAKKAGGGGGGSAADGAKRAAEEAADRLNALKESMRTEEEVIKASYAERQATISSASTLSIEERKELSDRSTELYDKELADFQVSKGAEVEELRKSLRTEEEVIRESYAARSEMLLKNTEEGSLLRAELQLKLQTEYETDLAAYAEAQEAKLEQVRSGYYTEEEESRAFHERQKKIIMEATFATETERQDYLRKEEERFNAERIQREQNLASTMRQVASNLFGSLAQLAGTYAKGKSKEAKKAFEMQKKFSIAQALINTYESATAAYKSMVSIPVVGVALGIAAAAAAIIAGIANVRQIQAQQFTAHDQGGRIAAGKIGIVGEYGPEFVRGPAAITGRQLTKQTLMGAGGGNNISLSSVFNINDTGTSSNTNGDKASMAREFKELVDMRFRDLVNQEQRAGGSLWRMQRAR